MVLPLLSSELVSGALLAGKYRLNEEIGRGAMGTVWRAINENLGQWVAVKIISPEHAGSAELRERFDTEARAAAKLRSRFVVNVYDNGETPSGLPFIVMELLDGECLEDRVARQGCLPLSEVARISRHLARALSKAHGEGIIHRDLKPANIFLTRSDAEEDGDDWTAKILDFGIAKMDDLKKRSTTQTGTVLGTPLFMSPEQVRGASSVDRRADLYSFGMVIFNMLTGTFAFEGQSFGDLLVSICVDPLPKLTSIAPHLPESLDVWFERACARDPDHRFFSAEEMLLALQAALGEQGSPESLNMTQTAVSGTLASPSYPFHSRPEQAATWTRPHATSGPRLDSAGASSMTVRRVPPPRSKVRVVLVAATFFGLFAAGGFAALRLSQPLEPQAPAALPTVVEVPEPVELSAVAEEPSPEPDVVHDLQEDQVTKAAARAPRGTTLDSLPFEEPIPTKKPANKSHSSSKPKPTSASKSNSRVPDLGF